MGVRLPTAASITLTTTVLTQNTETAFVTTPPLNLPFDNAQVLLFWYCDIAVGGSTTAMRINVRRGVDITGTLINVGANRTVASANIREFSGVYIDTPGAVAGVQYTLTALQTSAAGNGVFNDGSLVAMVL